MSKRRRQPSNPGSSALEPGLLAIPLVLSGASSSILLGKHANMFSYVHFVTHAVLLCFCQLFVYKFEPCFFFFDLKITCQGVAAEDVCRKTSDQH